MIIGIFDIILLAQQYMPDLLMDQALAAAQYHQQQQLKSIMLDTCSEFLVSLIVKMIGSVLHGESPAMSIVGSLEAKKRMLPRCSFYHWEGN